MFRLANYDSCLPSHLAFDNNKRVLLSDVPEGVMKHRSVCLSSINFQFYFDMCCLGFGVWRRAVSTISTVMNLIFILFSIVGFRGAADLNVMKIATHGVFVGVLCGVFVVYLFIVLALGKNDFWILLVIFCTVSVDIYASYQTLKWSYHLNKFEKTLNGNPSLLSTERFVPGIRSPTSSLPLGTPSKTRTTAQKKASGEKSYAESREKLQRKISELQADDNISDAPTQFICPISMCVMCDPVICDDGNTYEKEYIVKWFASGKRTSPVTNVNVGNRNTLIPNIALRTQIEEWVISKDNGDRV